MPKMPIAGGKKYKKRRGGNSQSTSTIGTSVYGTGNEQHAQAGSGNAIAFKSVGGNKQEYGGNAFTEVAVPATLLYANYKYNQGKVAYGRRTQVSRKRFGKNKQRRTRRRSYRRR